MGLETPHCARGAGLGPAVCTRSPAYSSPIARRVVQKYDEYAAICLRITKRIRCGLLHS